ncbi:hypothetical protein GCM10010978_07390 [Compostibacillus humi]|uniref:DUF7852 domain-containing protein n=1 Tax=Compostibacillus humi TaxID=1245525 RepID=A0A8J2ZPT5_9BACI|nr:DUF3794 domain-containing protein [Compostibacillus humi]GGH71445.1 hypothetical protein GCM10010978_07390 [Compostibacillus humi]
MSHKYDDKSCVSVNQSSHLGECTNEVATQPTLPAAGRTFRIPVTLGEFNVTSHLSSTITFPDPVMEIKNVKKRVEIVQCSLLTPSTDMPGTTSSGPFPLFLRGFVRKNIQYATPVYEPNGECVESELKSFTTRVEFECMTTIEELDNPVVLPVANDSTEYDFARTKKLGTGFPEKDHFHSSDISQFHQESERFYNDFPYCELVSDEILEWDEAIDRQTYGDAPVGEGTFQKVVEKMRLNFVIRILQVQNIEVGGGNGGAG